MKNVLRLKWALKSVDQQDREGGRNCNINLGSRGDEWGYRPREGGVKGVDGGFENQKTEEERKNITSKCHGCENRFIFSAPWYLAVCFFLK